MRDLDAVDAELTRQVSARLAQHEWTVIGVLAGGALKPFAEPLDATFGDLGLRQDKLVVIVCRRSEV